MGRYKSALGGIYNSFKYFEQFN